MSTTNTASSTAGVRRAVRAASLCNSVTMLACAASGSLAGSEVTQRSADRILPRGADDGVRNLSIGPVEKSFPCRACFRVRDGDELADSSQGAETGRARLRVLVLDGSAAPAIGPCLRPSQAALDALPERSPRQMIAESRRSGNTKRPSLARIVHGTPRDPQHAWRRRNRSGLSSMSRPTT